MKKLFIGCLFLLLSLSVSAQNITLPRSSPKATLSQAVGLSEITITYSRPSVKSPSGMDRTGKIWGGLVHYGMKDLRFGTAEASPWRAGANETTVITFSDDVEVEGKKLAAGTYGLYMIVEENNQVTVIFSNNATAWGSYFYDPKEDALRVKVASYSAPKHELLTYEFREVSESTALMTLSWEEKEIPVRFRFDTQNIALESMRRELQSVAGFSWQGYYQAANWCKTKEINQEEALAWIDQSIQMQPSFANWSVKVDLLSQLGREVEAEVAMREGLAYANAVQIHQYGRSLVLEGKKERAMRIFEMNADRNPDTWPVNVGLARGYSAMGNFKKALRYARIAAAEAPNEQERQNVKDMISKLEKSQDIN